MNELRVMGMLARRGIAQTFRRPQLLAPIVVFPSLFLAANTGGAGRATQLPGFPHVHGFLDFELPAAMLQSTLIAGVGTGIAIAIDIESGFLDRLLAAPIRRASFVLGRLAASGVLGVLAGVWFLTVGLIAGAHIEGGVAGALIVLLLCGLAATAAMVHEATGGRRTRLWRVLAVLGGLALVSLGLAVADDPGWVRL